METCFNEIKKKKFVLDIIFEKDFWLWNSVLNY